MRVVKVSKPSSRVRRSEPEIRNIPWRFPFLQEKLLCLRNRSRSGFNCRFAQRVGSSRAAPISYFADSLSLIRHASGSELPSALSTERSRQSEDSWINGRKILLGDGEGGDAQAIVGTSLATLTLLIECISTCIRVYAVSKILAGNHQFYDRYVYMRIRSFNYFSIIRSKFERSFLSTVYF